MRYCPPVSVPFFIPFFPSCSGNSLFLVPLRPIYVFLCPFSIRVLVPRVQGPIIPSPSFRSTSPPSSPRTHPSTTSSGPCFVSPHSSDRPLNLRPINLDKLNEGSPAFDARVNREFFSSPPAPPSRRRLPVQQRRRARSGPNLFGAQPRGPRVALDASTADDRNGDTLVTSDRRRLDRPRSIAIVVKGNGLCVFYR